jgi:hypothetical protein
MISKSSLELHEAYCVRTFMKCGLCLEMHKISEKENHTKDCKGYSGANKQGSNPKDSLLKNQPQFSSLQKPSQKSPLLRVDSLSPEKSLEDRKCAYCKVQTPIENLSDHEYYCGSRTKKCEVCNRNILYKGIRLKKLIFFFFKKTPL